MATIGTDPNGSRRILYCDPDGSRKTVRLGKVTKKEAESAKVHIERLHTAVITGREVKPQTSLWVAQQPRAVQQRLVELGLIQERENDPEGGIGVLLGEFIDAYIARRVDVKPATRISYNQARANLLKYFGQHRLLHTITAGEADDWRLYLKGHGVGGKHHPATDGQRQAVFQQCSTAQGSRK